MVADYIREMSSARRPRVFVTSPIPDKVALDLLKESCDVDVYQEYGFLPRDELLKRVQNVDALFIFNAHEVNEELLDAAGSNLKVISTMSVGFDHINVGAVKARNVKLGYTPDVLTEATAELAIGLMLATARRFYQMRDYITSGEWSSCAWGPSIMLGTEIRNSIIGIIGLGRIGQAIAKIVNAFKPTKILYTGTASKPEGDELGAKFVSMDGLLEASDFVVVACALNENTKGFIGAESFNKMKNTAIFINIGRGGLVQQDALIEALKAGKIRAAGLDVMTPEPLPKDHPLLQAPNITLVPHIGSATVATRRDMAVLTARNILAGLNGQPLPAELC